MKRYLSKEEIEQEQCFRSRNPINQANYARLRGWYAFTEGNELECCCEKPNGNLCETSHRRGWVAELIDGTCTVLGGTCATEKFNADSVLVRDIAVANNELARQERVARLTEMLRQRDAAMASLEAAKRQLVEMKRTLAGYRDELGRNAWNVLVDMSRTGNAAIRVIGVVPEEYGADGELVRDHQMTPINIGSLSGVVVCNPARIETTLESIRKVEAAYRQAGSDAERVFKSKEVKALTSALADQPRVMSEAQEWAQQFEKFNANDFSILAFAVVDLKERLQVAQFALKRRGPHASRDAAKRSMYGREAELKRQYNVKLIKVR